MGCKNKSAEMEKVICYCSIIGFLFDKKQPIGYNNSVKSLVRQGKDVFIMKPYSLRIYNLVCFLGGAPYF